MSDQQTSGASRGTTDNHRQPQRGRAMSELSIGLQTKLDKKGNRG